MGLEGCLHGNIFRCVVVLVRIIKLSFRDYRIGGTIFYYMYLSRPKCDRKYCDVEENGSPGYLMIINCNKEGKLWEFTSYNNYLFSENYSNM